MSIDVRISVLVMKPLYIPPILMKITTIVYAFIIFLNLFTNHLHNWLFIEMMRNCFFKLDESLIQSYKFQKSLLMIFCGLNVYIINF